MKPSVVRLECESISLPIQRGATSSRWRASGCWAITIATWASAATEHTCVATPGAVRSDGTNVSVHATDLMAHVRLLGGGSKFRFSMLRCPGPQWH